MKCRALITIVLLFIWQEGKEFNKGRTLAAAEIQSLSPVTSAPMILVAALALQPPAPEDDDPPAPSEPPSTENREDAPATESLENNSDGTPALQSKPATTTRPNVPRPGNPGFPRRDEGPRRDSDSGNPGAARTRNGPRGGQNTRPERSSKPDSLSNTNAPSGRDYAAFKIISDRNIFNVHRSAQIIRAPIETSRPQPAETLTLVGILTYEKGPYAFFDGSSSSFRKVVEPGKTIAGCKLLNVTPESAELEVGTNRFELRVGMQMRRQAGDWHLSESSVARAKRSAPAAQEAVPPGDDDDIVKRLMQQRAQELK